VFLNYLFFVPGYWIYLSLSVGFFFFKKKEMILDKNKGHLGESGDKRNGDRLAG
jgi:hypothetical protein